VAISARDSAALRGAGESIKHDCGLEPICISADLSIPADVARLAQDAVAALGGIDILVVNSGHMPYGGIEDLSEEHWYGAFELLLMSAVRLARVAIPVMRARGGGDIVFLGSASVRQPPDHLLLSSVMRLGVVGLAKTLSRNLAADNIRVNVIAPGYFATGRVQQRIAEQVANGELRENAERVIAGDIPMQRLGDPAELAELVAFVISRKAAFLNGVHLAIDGGATGFPL
jgi:3-oxoacyl-[acyl-carrier protein] reductase